jgi:hypothetical protein
VLCPRGFFCAALPKTAGAPSLASFAKGGIPQLSHLRDFGSTEEVGGWPKQARHWLPRGCSEDLIREERVPQASARPWSSGASAPLQSRKMNRAFSPAPAIDPQAGRRSASRFWVAQRFSAAINILLRLRALAPEVSKPPEEIQCNFTLPAPDKRAPQPPAQGGRAALQRRVSSWKNEPGL